MKNDTKTFMSLILISHKRQNQTGPINSKEIQTLLDLSPGEMDQILDTLIQEQLLTDKAISTSNLGIGTASTYLKTKRISYIKFLSISPLPKNGLDGDRFHFKIKLVNQDCESTTLDIAVEITDSLSKSWYYEVSKDISLEQLLIPVVLNVIKTEFVSNTLSKLELIILDSHNTKTEYPYSTKNLIGLAKAEFVIETFI